MATKVTFGKQTIVEPGVYSEIVSGIKNPSLSLSYGNILIIDTGKGLEFGGGSGVSGILKEKKDSIESFSDFNAFREKVMGGLFWDLAEPLWYPKDYTIPGISKLSFIKAAATVPAEITWTFVGSGSDGGTITVQVRNEGKVGNGILGDETLATEDYTTTVTGAIADKHTLQVDEGSGYIDLGEFIVVTGSETPTEVATALAIAVNILTSTHGYTATSSGAITTATARRSTGTGRAIDANSWDTLYTGTGTAAGPNADPVTPDLFVLDFERGIFKGLDSNSIPYDEVAEVDTLSKLLAKSIEFANIDNLAAWMQKNTDFNQYFAYKSHTKVGDGSITNADLATYGIYNLASGGTEVYSTTELDTVLDNITEADYTFVLSDNWSEDAKNADNGKILAHLLTEAKGMKFMVVGGGSDRDEFKGASNSIGIAEYYDSDRVVVVHAGPKKLQTSGTFKDYDSIYKVAAVLGRICGLPPQVPATFKGLNMDGDRHDMNVEERKLALEKGVLHTKFDDALGEFIINQAINTEQDNDFLINPDATSHEIQIKRIAAQLNKLIEYNATISLFKGEVGPNRHVLSPITVLEWTKGFLKRQTATDLLDNLILGFEQVTVEVYQDTYKIRYGFYPNLPVNKLLFTGVMLDPYA